MYWCSSTVLLLLHLSGMDVDCWRLPVWAGGLFLGRELLGCDVVVVWAPEKQVGTRQAAEGFCFWLWLDTSEALMCFIRCMNAFWEFFHGVSSSFPQPLHLTEPLAASWSTSEPRGPTGALGMV